MEKTVHRLFVIAFLFASFTVFGQSKADKKYEKELYQKANEQMYEENYLAAQETYLKLLEIVPKNDQYLLETGLAYFFASTDREKSLEYFNRAKANSRPDTIPELFYYSGRANQLTSNFTEAISDFERFKTYLKDNRRGKEMKEEVDNYIKMCQHGQYHLNLYAKNPVANPDKPIKDLTKYFINDTDYVAIENFGKKFNSTYADYTSYVINNRTTVAFTSRRPRIGSDADPLFDGQFFEKIFVSRFKDGEWKQPVEVNYTNVFGTSVDNPEEDHQAIIYVNQNEDMALLYRDNKILFTKRTGAKWSTPEAFPEVINNPSDLQSSAAITNDGKVLYFVSQKKDGYGGRDIYRSELQADGSWSKAENLGAVVNTEKDEESPFITKDGSKLYFSSQGHSSMGGYDVFVSERKPDGTWDTPSSLGSPINSPADEIYYIPSTAGELAYYSSSRTGGYGDIDIYKIYKGVQPLEKDTLPALASAEEEQEVMDEEKEPTADTTAIAMAETDEETASTGEQIEEQEPTETAEKAEDKEVAVGTPLEEKEAKEATEKDVKETQETAAEKEPITTAKEKKPTSTPKVKDIPQELLANLDFGFNSGELSEENKTQLNNLAEELKKDRNKTITIDGHTDYLGTEEVNMEVSKQRALMVFNYLVEEGVEPNRVNIDYFGETKPLVPGKNADGTDNPENRAKNRRVELDVKQYNLFRFVLYGFDSYALDEVSKKTLDDVISYLKANPNKVAQLNGYTDKIGNVDYNKYLSKKRVEAVYNYLTAAGIAKDRLERNSYGVENPTIPEGSGLPQKYNRRVEIMVN